MVVPMIKALSCAVLCTALIGCATNPAGPLNPKDPFEGANRSMFAFNDGVDRAVLKPLAQSYQAVTTPDIRSCINNMFLNVGEIWSGANSVMQGRQEDALTTMGRFLLNTTLGLGCFDWAGANGAKRIPNDFGVTLGVWGLSTGPYVVLPILGPSNARDGMGKIADLYINQIEVGTSIQNVGLRNSLYALELLERREALLGISDTIDKTALDSYSFIRDAYLQSRAAQVRGAAAEADHLPNYDDIDDATTTQPSAESTKK